MRPQLPPAMEAWSDPVAGEPCDLVSGFALDAVWRGYPSIMATGTPAAESFKNRDGQSTSIRNRGVGWAERCEAVRPHPRDQCRTSQDLGEPSLAVPECTRRRHRAGRPPAIGWRKMGQAGAGRGGGLRCRPDPQGIPQCSPGAIERSPSRSSSRSPVSLGGRSRLARGRCRRHPS